MWQLMIPVMDNLVTYKNRTDVQVKMTAEETVELVKDAFISAGEVSCPLLLYIFCLDPARFFVLQPSLRLSAYPFLPLLVARYLHG
jgi:hypothetical protein